MAAVFKNIGGASALPAHWAATPLQNHIQFYHKDSRTLQGAKKCAPSSVEKANVSLKYFTIDLACLFGGKGYNAKEKGVRHHKKYKNSLQLCMKLTGH